MNTEAESQPGRACSGTDDWTGAWVALGTVLHAANERDELRQ